MTTTDPDRNDFLWILALLPPLAVRLYEDGADAAVQRLVLLALAAMVVYAWAALFARRAGRSLGPGLPAFALTFVVLLPEPVAWGAAALSLSFGAVFGREVFGGRTILPPALVALAFAIFSFPEGGFEARDILSWPADPLFAASCLPGAAVLALRGALAWPVALGAAAGAAATAALMGDPAWPEHPEIGAFAAGVLFLAAAAESSARGAAAQLVQGLLIGALAIAIRLANPDGLDGVVFAALLGGLFAPLIGRALAWRPRHG